MTRSSILPRLAVRAAGLALLTALAACEGVGSPAADQVSQPTSVLPPGVGYDPATPGLYCYRSLADVDCYREPQPGPPNRLVGAYTDLTETP